jgi:hypothetical protein
VEQTYREFFLAAGLHYKRSGKLPNKDYNDLLNIARSALPDEEQLTTNADQKLGVAIFGDWYGRIPEDYYIDNSGLFDSSKVREPFDYKNTPEPTDYNFNELRSLLERFEFPHSPSQTRRNLSDVILRMNEIFERKNIDPFSDKKFNYRQLTPANRVFRNAPNSISEANIVNEEEIVVTARRVDEK